MSDRMPEDMSEYMPEDMPDRMPDWMPEDMSDRVPEDMPDIRMPEDMPDRMSEDMPGHMLEDMPDRMPNRMSEDMSDRMPEDLPVRKCINVMVGITRSKVIVFWFSKLQDMRVLTHNTGISNPGYLIYDAHKYLRHLSFSSWYDDSNQVTSDNPILGTDWKCRRRFSDFLGCDSLNWDHHLSCSNRIYLLVI